MTISKARRLLDDPSASPKQRRRALEMLTPPASALAAQPTPRRVSVVPAMALLAIAGMLAPPAYRGR